MPDPSAKDPYGFERKIPPITSSEKRWEKTERGACELFPDGGYAHLQLGQRCSPFENPAAFLVHLVDALTTAEWHSFQ
jgi:hypothetical protein